MKPFETCKIICKEGEYLAPAYTDDRFKGIAITMATFGRFNLTHMKSGHTIFSGRFERFDIAFLYMARLHLLAITLGFTWDCDNPEKYCKENKNEKVPFKDSSATVYQWISSLNTLPFGEIDTPHWEGSHLEDDIEETLKAIESIENTDRKQD